MAKTEFKGNTVTPVRKKKRDGRYTGVEICGGMDKMG